MRNALLTCLLLIAFKNVNAQLVINEVSQGSGSQEYVEFIVMGNRACIAPIPTVDLRGIVIDDNNGYFNTGAGTGIASGAVQFALIPFWSAIPQGTIIVIYNDADVDPLLPPMDVSMNDGNCRLVIPINSNLFNGQSSLPNISNPNYPPQASWVNGGGSWTQISMNNSNDSFQIRASITSTVPSYSVSWGNNNALGNAQVYDLFGGSSLFSNTMSVNTDPLNNANWYATAGPGNPGAPNTTQNQTYLGITNPGCYGSSLPVFDFDITPTSCGATCNGAISVSVTGGSPYYYYSWSNGQSFANITDVCAGNISVTITDDYGCIINFDTVVPQSSTLTPQVLVTNETCNGECDGGAVASATGGAPPYSYSWSNSFNGANNQNLCPGLYTVTVTDQNGCSGTLDITIASGTVIPSPTVDNPGVHQEQEGMVQLTASPTGGTWSSSCGSCISSAGVFNTTISGAGIFDVCYTITSGNCSSQDCETIEIESPCQLTPQALVANETCSGECDGGAVASAIGGTPPYSYSWSDSFNGANNQDLCPGLYVVTVTDQNGCSETLDITIASGTVIPSPTVDNPGVHQLEEGTIQITASPTGGVWSSSCGNCISSAGVFNTAISGAGTFDVCYTITSGNCSSQDCETIEIEAPCQDTYLTLSGNLCEGDTLTINGVDYTTIGTYTQTFPLANGCDSILTLVLIQCLDGTDEIEIPNVITPNNDNVNDIWKVSTEKISLKEGFIVNRWGEVVKTFADNTIEWDGTSTNLVTHQLDSVEGVYFYRLVLYSESIGEFSKQGFIQLFR